MGYSSLPPDASAVRKAEQFWDTLNVRGGDAPFTACFIGTLGRQFALESVLTAARLLKHRGSAVRFVICGSGDRSARLRRSGAGLDNVLFPGWVDAASIYVLMRRSHVGLDPLSDRYDFLATINNKAIEYMSAGLPLVASPLRGELYRLIREGGLGRSYDVHDTEALADILQDLERDRIQLREMSGRAARKFQEEFTAEKVYTAMMEYLELLAAAGAGRSMEIIRGKASA